MSIRFVVTYARRNIHDGTKTDLVKRAIYGTNWSDVAASIAKLPRWIETLSVKQMPETPAEAAARIARENDLDAVPYGC